MAGTINIYARQKPMFNAVGRADYIGSDHRQENLLATASTISMPDYWHRLAEDSQTAFRQAGGRKTKKVGDETVAKRVCEAREIHVQLPDSALQKMTADQLAKKIANDFRSQYGVDCLVAVHYNKKKNNLHFHILFSERQQLQEPEIKIADRNVFLDADGIRKRTKKEILDADGNLLPGCSIVKKGEVISARYFGDKNPMFSEKSWMDEYRHHMADWINDNLQPDKKRVVFDPNGPYLAQKHLDKGTPEEKLRELEEWNRLVKQFNALFDGGSMTKEEALEYKTRIKLSPDQTAELKAVLGELYRECYPDDDLRGNWDYAASQSAKAPLSADVKNRHEKQELRDLYKAQGEARIQLIDACTDEEEDAAEVSLDTISLEIKKKIEELSFTANQQRLRELGRLAGVKPAEVDRLYRDVPKMTGAQWKEVWAGCKSAQSQAWENYRIRQDSLKNDLNRAYKRRKKVKEAEWLLNPRNRKATLLGALYAAIVLARNDSLWAIDREIDRLKDEQTALRREVQKFKAATDQTYETLHTKGLDPTEYVGCVQRMQRIADRIQNEASLDTTDGLGLTKEQTRKILDYILEESTRGYTVYQKRYDGRYMMVEGMRENGFNDEEILQALKKKYRDNKIIQSLDKPGALEHLIADAESNRQDVRQTARKTWDGADDNNGGFSGDR